MVGTREFFWWRGTWKRNISQEERRPDKALIMGKLGKDSREKGGIGTHSWCGEGSAES